MRDFNVTDKVINYQLIRENVSDIESFYKGRILEILLSIDDKNKFNSLQDLLYLVKAWYSMESVKED